MSAEISSMEALCHYAQRFAKSSDETMKVKDFDAKGFKWNIDGLLNDELVDELPQRSSPDYFFHRIPVSVPQPTEIERPSLVKVPDLRRLDELKKAVEAKTSANSMAAPSGNFGKTALPPGHASMPKLMSGQAPSPSRFTGVPKGVALRVPLTSSPLPGAPRNQSILPKYGQGAKGSSKGMYCGVHPKGSSVASDRSSMVAQCINGRTIPGKEVAPFNQEYYSLLVRELDGQNRTTCPHCSLPLGDFGYDGKEGSVHAECMAQILLQDLQKSESQRQSQSEVKKSLRRDEYGIGWKVEHIPRNIDLQPKLKDVTLSHGMCCLVLNEASRSVRLAATFEPSAAINLEYLSLALQVRRREGREPFFSLDPIFSKNGAVHSDGCPKADAQVKRFEPEWLAGTSVGEVLFQADYLLKELSMGEHEQPVVGMRNIFEMEQDEDSHQTWSAREWFMVRKAEVHLSEDNVLIPCVKMGVEAREQVRRNGTLIDAPMTKKGHPMVKYAESFTKNFDLIAERKSAIFHLRELAKASVMAKFLLDSSFEVEDSWFNLASEAEEACALEIPQLWNERLLSKIHVRDGALVDKSLRSQVHGIYGGVHFGLDKFKVEQAVPRKAAQQIQPGAARRGLLAGGVLARSSIPTSVAPAPLSSAVSAMAALPLSTPLSMTTPSRGAALAASVSALPAPPRGTVPLAGMSALSIPGVPRGVDLNLNQFSLDVPEQLVEGQWTCEPQSKDAAACIARSFWSCVEDGQKSDIFDEADLELLKDMFNPNLSDRRAEGDSFAPPDTCSSYVSKLRSLVQDEAEIQKQRKEHFFSSSFIVGSAGSLFPSSWTSNLRIDQAVQPQSEVYQPRTDYFAEAKQILASTAPHFDKQTEDGTRFRIYKVGSIEVRTSQEYHDEETIGAVFSIRSKAPQCSRGAVRCASGREKVLKVTEYVERGCEDGGEQNLSESRYYLVLETEHGHTILTEHVQNGLVTWEENSPDLEDRTSLAKVIRSAACRKGVSVQDMRAHRMATLQLTDWANKGQNYATSAYVIALGGIDEVLKAAEERHQQILAEENHALDTQTKA